MLQTWMRHGKRMAFSLGIVTLSLLSLFVDALAQTGGDLGASTDKGRELVQRLCTSCHLLPDSTGASAIVGIPTFRAIANRPGQTGRNIESVLINPHPPMPDTRLSYDEIRDIIAYIETLRPDGSAPLPQKPGTQPGEDDKPKPPRAG